MTKDRILYVANALINQLIAGLGTPEDQEQADILFLKFKELNRITSISPTVFSDKRHSAGLTIIHKIDGERIDVIIALNSLDYYDLKAVLVKPDGAVIINEMNDVDCTTLVEKYETLTGLKYSDHTVVYEWESCETEFAGKMIPGEMMVCKTYPKNNEVN